jgi:hypothetical protein
MPHADLVALLMSQAGHQTDPGADDFEITTALAFSTLAPGVGLRLSVGLGGRLEPPMSASRSSQ